MIDRKQLLADLKPQVRKLEDDLRTQIIERIDIYERLQNEYREAFEVERTAQTWETWRDERVTQAAAAWVLGTVFVRFCEDNGLLEQPFLAGPTANRMTLAEESQGQFFREHPGDTDRDWMLAAFDAIQSAVQSGTKGVALFSREHNPLYQIPVSHDAAKALIAFWRRRGESGELVHDFTDAEWDTRFLGDLYQDLSEAARKNYALLQTPEFVEEFILDLTLTPAIEEFGFEEIKLIDPTCGSGHFLLGAFHRLVKEWEEHAPNRDAHERVRLALESVHGVDINPFAVAIARFRLLVAALRAAGFRTLTETASYSFPIKIAVGDSLIKARQLSLFYDKRDKLAEFAYETEDVDDFPGILEQGRYHVVVGNPPYITIKDKALNGLYRDLYSSCTGLYALSVPFAQRFFELARTAQKGRLAGYAGQITANSFMRREFGKKLIEQFFAHQVALTHVIDSSGAFIPGHGTPTVVLIGRNRNADWRTAIRTVLGIRGEPSIPEVPSKGLVWSSILATVSNPNSRDSFTSSVDIARNALSKHPWSLTGGGASELMNQFETAGAGQLNAVTTRLGFFGDTHADEVFSLPARSVDRKSITSAFYRAAVRGDGVRDWVADFQDILIFPYDARHQLRAPQELDLQLERFLWPWRTPLGARRLFTGETYSEAGRPWYAWHQLPKPPVGATLVLAWGEVATHNHFILDRGENAYNRTAPIINLKPGETEDDCLGLLGVLNSSTSCFWLKQVCHNKGSQGVNEGFKSQAWERFYQFNSTMVSQLPLPDTYPFDIARHLDILAQQLSATTPSAIAAFAIPTRDKLNAARSEWHSIRAQMIALQEELDWLVYALYGLLSEELTAPPGSVPELQLGERAFEIVLARNAPAGEATPEWFTRHGSTPITEIPAHWPEDYKALVEKRIAVIENNRHLALIERPECKRRWATEGWDKLQERALHGWLLDRCENRNLWYQEQDGIEQPRPLTAVRLAADLQRDPDVVAVADLYAPGKDFTKVIAELVADEHVPYLAALRYKEDGLSKRARWENVWAEQRREDAAETEDEKAEIRAKIPVPPKYSSADFRKTSYWRHRGKLDVPKERFISYPDASRTGDPSLLLGWAGWDHREQAQALAGLIGERCDEDGWPTEQLVPLLAGLREVLPWVWQWHGDFDPDYGASPAEGYDGFLTSYRERLRLTDDALANWRPPKATRGRART